MVTRTLTKLARDHVIPSPMIQEYIHFTDTLHSEDPRYDSDLTTAGRIEQVKVVLVRGYLIRYTNLFPRL
jgi:hypothetical protein